MANVRKHGVKWQVKWRVDGRQVYESFGTEREARDFAAKVEARTILDGVAPMVVDDDALTLSKWWARWEPGRPWTESSRRTHDVHWRKIKPVFGSTPIGNITTADVQRFHRRLEGKGHSPGYIGAIHRTLSMALQGALVDGVIDRNPARYAPLRRVTEEKPVALDRATTDALLDSIATTTPGLATFARLIAATGLRRSEATGLTWDRVDLDDATLTVDRQMDYTAPTLPAWSPTKNKKTRTVVLTDEIVADLRVHRAAQTVTAIGGDGLVFTRDDGSVWPRARLQESWRAAVDALDAPLPGPKRNGWHVLRHTVGSRLLEAGVPPAEVADLLGHTVEQLLSTYSHITNRAEADERLRAALAR